MIQYGMIMMFLGFINIVIKLNVNTVDISWDTSYTIFF